MTSPFFYDVPRFTMLCSCSHGEVLILKFSEIDPIAASKPTTVLGLHFAAGVSTKFDVTSCPQDLAFGVLGLWSM